MGGTTVWVAPLLVILSQTRTATTPEEIEVRADRPIASSHLMDPTAAGSIVDLEDRLQSLETLADVLPELPGARVVRTGAHGAFSGVALRGAELRHTIVFLGDVPLNGPDTGGFDLSLLPLDGLARVEVYRGGAPVWLDPSSVGGVVRLIPMQQTGTHLGAEVGLGSFGTYWGAAQGGVTVGRWQIFATAGGLTGTNDFSYLDDGATLFDPTDDRVRPRDNADVDRAQGLVNAVWQSEADRITLLGFGLWRHQGEPGPASASALFARRTTGRWLGSIAYDRADRWGQRPYHLQVLASAGYNTERFIDETGELGLGPQDTDDGIASMQGRLAATIEVWPWLETTMVWGVRYDRYDPNNRLAIPGDQPSDRLTQNVAMEVGVSFEVEGVRVEARPSIRGNFSQATLVDRVFGQLEARRVTEALPTYRLGVVVSPWSSLSVSASASSGARLPSVLELFGNRGALLPNPNLAPESSRNVDMGIVWQSTGSAGRLQVEARAFRLWIDDLIRYRQTAQFGAVAENVDVGRIWGVELGMSGAWGDHVSAVASATYLHSEDGLERQLPLRRPWQAYLRPEVHSGALGWGPLERIGAFVDVEYQGSNFLDPANLVEVPDRMWWGMGFRASLASGWSLSGQLRDVFNEGGSDLLGFPLPGRRFDVSLAYRMAFE